MQDFAEAIAAAAPQLAGTALLKPVTMTLFGMSNWTFTWLKDDGPVRHADMASVVADLFLRGVGAVPPQTDAASGGSGSRRVSRPAGRLLRQAA